MIFNGSKSYIHSEETINNRSPPFKLFIKDKQDREQIRTSIALLEDNLLRVYQALRQLKDRENIGYVSVSNDEVEYPNRIISFLPIGQTNWTTQLSMMTDYNFMRNLL